jgi:hypothetical protein
LKPDGLHWNRRIPVAESFAPAKNQGIPRFDMRVRVKVTFSLN